MTVRRLRPRRRARGRHVHPDRHRQAQRCRSPGLARRRARPDRGDAAEPARQTPPLELGSGAEARSSRIGRRAPDQSTPNALAAQTRPAYPCGLRRMDTLHLAAVNLKSQAQLEGVGCSPRLPNPSVNVNCIKIRDDDAWTSRADFGWSNIALTNGVFSGNRLRGQIYGPNHEEVGGVLARTGIDGTFGARRQ